MAISLVKISAHSEYSIFPTPASLDLFALFRLCPNHRVSADNTARFRTSIVRFRTVYLHRNAIKQLIINDLIKWHKL